ncbi:MAG: hypothetical protein K5656_05795 [Lachnospiraceae bacterium]|nr:hypothetical protein [Lachnospiraceae bacterium]
MNKGDYGYMNKYKNKHAIALLVYAVLIMVFFFVGKAKFFDSTISAVLVVLAILMVLPAAKHFVAMFIVFNWTTLDKKSIDYFDKITSDIKTGISIYDLTLSSEEIIYYSPYIYINGDNLYCLVLNATVKTSADKVKAYIEKILSNHGYNMNYIMCRSVEAMNKALSEALPNEDENIKELENAKELLLQYSV